MNQINLIDLISNFTLLEVVKWFLVVGLVLYSAFAAVIVRQVGVMSTAVEDEFNGVIKMFSWAHLLMAIMLTVVAMVTL